MKNNIITLSMCVAAVSAFSQTAASNVGPSYNSVQVQYVGSNKLDAVRILAEAQLGWSNFFVDGQVAAGSGSGSFSGGAYRSEGVNLGYKINVGPGDINLLVGYNQEQQEKPFTTAYTGFGSDLNLGLAWRQKINEAIEYGIIYQHWSGSFNYSSPIQKVANNDDSIYAEIRYHFIGKWDLGLAYQWDKSSSSSSNSTWFVGLGYNF